MKKIQSLQQEIAEMYLARGFGAASPQTLMLGAMEELGELATAILMTACDDFKPGTGKLLPAAYDPAREVGDCITYLLALCNLLGIEPYFKWGSKMGLGEK